MLQQLFIALRMLLLLTILTGIVYPLTVTLVAQTAFSHHANGQIIRVNGEAVGSELIGQSFSKPEYFWGRLSATSPLPYNAAASSGSNFGPQHPGFREAVDARLAALKEHPTPTANVPVDLLTASGSGLDPHISPAAAEFQVPRIAKARAMSEDALRALIRTHTESRQLGVLGEPRVNVLRLNLALDQRPGRTGD